MAIEPFESVLRNHGIHSVDLLPTGAVLAVAQLVLVLPADQAWSKIDPCAQERHFGDFAPERFAWKLERVEDFDCAIPAKGSLKIWEWNVTLCPFCELPLKAKMCSCCQEG